MIQAHVLRNLITFLDRVTLTGKEVPAFNECMVALGNEALQENPAPDGSTIGRAPKHPAELAAEGM